MVFPEKMFSLHDMFQKQSSHCAAMGKNENTEAGSSNISFGLLQTERVSYLEFREMYQVHIASSSHFISL